MLLLKQLASALSKHVTIIETITSTNNDMKFRGNKDHSLNKFVKGYCCMTGKEILAVLPMDNDLCWKRVPNF